MACAGWSPEKFTFGRRVLATLGVLCAIALVGWALMPKPIRVEAAMVTRGRARSTNALLRSRLASAAPRRFQDHAAEHELAQAKAVLTEYQKNETAAPSDAWNVTAPVSGLVFNVAQESETVLQPGAAILTIGDPHDLEIVVDVLSTEAVEIRPGAPVAIEHWGGAGGLAGRLRRVEPAAFTKISTLGVEEQRVNVLIDITSPQEDWAGLGEAYQVDARITAFTKDGATIVPAGALFRVVDTWKVYVVKDGRAQLRTVSLVRRAGGLAAVSAGVEPGGQVVLYPGDRVADAVRVIPN